MTKCDWCGAEAKSIRIRLTANGENACQYCAPYMQAALVHPETDAENRALAVLARQKRSNMVRAWTDGPSLQGHV